MKSSFRSLLAEFLLFLAYAAVLIFSSSDAFAEGFTVHTVSYHVGADDLNNVNVGLGYDIAENVRIGALYNSYSKPSAYAAAFVSLNKRVRIGAGVITGYAIGEDWRLEGKTTSILPLAAAEVDLTEHVSVIWFGQALNLALKF